MRNWFIEYPSLVARSLIALWRESGTRIDMVVILLNQVKCLSWCDCPNPQRLGTLEIIDVVSDNDRATRRCCQLDNKIVVRIGQERPPCVKNLLRMSESAQNIDNNLDLFGSECRHKARA